MTTLQRSSYLTATKRLDEALERLERSVSGVSIEQQRGARVAAHLEESERENQSLRKERVEMNAALTRLQTDYDALHRAAEKVYGKLDDSIKKIHQIIEPPKDTKTA